MKILLTLVFLTCVVRLAFSQDKPLDQHMDFEKYDPPSTLVVTEHHPKKAKFPFIDIHNHQGDMSATTLADLVKDMDKLNMAVMNNLSGRGWGGSGTDHLLQSIESIRKNYPSRFILLPTSTSTAWMILPGLQGPWFNSKKILKPAQGD